MNYGAFVSAVCRQEEGSNIYSISNTVITVIGLGFITKFPVRVDRKSDPLSYMTL